MTDASRGAGEFQLIDLIRRRATMRADVVLGIGDDAAIVQVPAGRQLVIATDTLNSGVHFPAETAPADVGWKALAVNLSDLAAMAAEPAWCTLSLSLPDNDAAWLEAFMDGFFELAGNSGIALVGGDTTRGPLSVCVTVHGLVESGRALRRDAACVGDDVWVTGTLGDAAGALAQWQAGGACDPALRRRLDRPEPRLSIAAALRDGIHACIDISDGLLADLQHICEESRAGAAVLLERLPVSPQLDAAFDVPTRQDLQATGGDDYELCFTAPAHNRAAIERVARENPVPITRVGTIVAGSGVRALSADGSLFAPSRLGFQHFAE